MEGPARPESRRLLHKMERELEKCIESLERRTVASLRESTGELALADNHPADLASETFERSKDLGAARDLRRRIRALQAGLARLGEGRYGRCEVCGRAIEPERLELVPEASSCAGCAREEPTGFAAEEPLPCSFHGKDAWAQVARYGTSDSPQDDPPVGDGPTGEGKV